MSENTTSNGSTPDNPSLLDSLRDASQALISAGSRLGDVVSDFSARFREDRNTNDLADGAHAEPNPLAEEDSTVDRLKAASAEAREGLSKAASAADYKEVSATFAGRAEEIIRDLAASARRAAEHTKDSTAAVEAKSALENALASVRSGFDEVVEGVRSRAADLGDKASEKSEDLKDDADSLIEDLSARFDSLFNRAGSAGTDPADSSAEGVAHMIDGEVISTDEGTGEAGAEHEGR